MGPDFYPSAITRDETSNPDFMLQFKIPPPASVAPGVKFTLPVVIATCPAARLNPLGYDPDQQLMLYASLRDETGREAAVTGGLTGELSDSVHSGNDDTIKGYSKFANLAINRPGRYRMRVCLAIAGGGQPGLVMKAHVDSHVIRVDPSAETTQRPSKWLFIKQSQEVVK